MEALPDEILEIIIKHSNNRSVHNLSATCKRIRNVVSNILARQKCDDKNVEQCYMCVRYSMTHLPIHYLVWPHVGDMMEHMICSSACRQKCLTIRTSVYCVGFGRK
jgi:hypothetical protein